MTTTLAIWLITLVLFLTHQIEEVVYPVAAWGRRILDLGGGNGRPG